MKLHFYEALAMTIQRITRLALSTALGLVFAPLADASVWYVRADAAPGGNGTSWASAFDTVQAGIAAGSLTDKVWVKAGTYLPGTAASPRTVTFQLKNGVAVYGGFNGTETLLAQRDWIANPTVLSGDLLQDDGPSFANRGDNAYHVVRALGVNASGVLDGFVVRGGNASDIAIGHGLGGGILGGRGTLRNLTVVDNEAFSGGGIALAEGASNPTPIEGCVFRSNRAVHHGGGMLSHVSGIELRACVFAGNSADITGGIYLNLKEDQGPGSLVNCLIVGNSGTQYGGGLHSRWCTLSVTSTVIAFNHAGTDAGGASSISPPNPITFTNSILWGNTSGSGGPVLRQQLDGYVAVFDSSVEGGPAPLDVDPRWTDAFGTDGIVGTEDDDFTLSCVSPYIDRGANAHAAGIALDLAGNPRFADDPATPDLGTGTPPIVDLGPYEFVCACDDVETYCTALPNTSGLPASISASGSTSLFANSLVLQVVNGPPLKNGLFFYGALQTSLPWGDGIRCVGGSLFRLPIVTLDANGSVSFPFDVTLPPASGGPGLIVEGSTWNFQFFFRDPQGGPAGWNSSDALNVAFCR